VIGAALLLVVVTSTACSHHEVPASTATRVLLRNFRVAMTPRLRSGLNRLEISSVGPSMHELVVAATELPAGNLPLAANGTVDSESAAIRVVHEAEAIDMGDHRALTVRLQPGHYVMFCNMEGHYQAGMATGVTVV
jgi:hypothetical protein